MKDTSKYLLKEENFYNWQKDFKEIILNNNNRCCFWLFDKNGKQGKTQFMLKMINDYGGLFLTGGKCTDIMNLAINNIDYFKYEQFNDEQKFVWYNLPRNTKPEHISYNSIECFKDGLINNSKFECKSEIIIPPIICIFANSEPCYEQLTTNKWKVYTIENKELIHFDRFNYIKSIFNVFKKNYYLSKYRDEDNHYDIKPININKIIYEEVNQKN